MWENQNCQKWMRLKIIFLLVLFLIYMIINSTNYDFLSTSQITIQKDTQLLLFGTQLFFQAIIFSILFVTSCDTFPFQVGYVGVLAKEFSLTILTIILYFGLSTTLGILKMVGLVSYDYCFYLKN